MNNSGQLILMCLIGLSIGAAPELSRADFVVTGSNSDQLKAGTTLGPAAAIDLKKGHWLRVIDRDTGQTSTLNGPYAGRLQEYKSQCSELARVAGRCGSSEPRLPIGGTRRPQ